MAELFNNDLQLLTAMLAPRLRTVFKDNHQIFSKFMNPELVKKLVDIESVMPRSTTPDGFKEILVLKGIDANDIDLMVTAYTRAYNPDTEKLIYESVRRSIFTVYINSLKQGGVMKLLESIKSNELFFPEYGLINNEYSRIVNLADLSANTANIDLGRSFRSSFGFINSLTIGGNGYYQDQLIVVSAPPGCFTGDTRVMTLDGKYKTMEDLYKSGARDIEVYCCDDNGTPHVSKAESCQLTKYVDSIYEVNIDGYIVKCTPDHKFMLTSGEWIEAKDLVENDSLMPINSGKISSPEQITKDLYQTERSKFEFSNFRTPSYDKAEYYYDGNKVQMYKEAVNWHNHTVNSVTCIKLTEPIPVYDLVNVEKYHNFAILTDEESNSGVFVHNCGKSLFCISEAISACKQGMRVLYTALGDLTDFDFMSRPCSIALNKPMMSVVDNLVENYNSMLSKYPYMTNFDVDFESPGTISVSDWIEKLKHSNLLDTHDVFVVDYDTNFKSDKDNIYMKGDEIYTSLVLLAKTYHKIVIVVAQPKQENWDSRKGGPMGLNALAESSRKQQHVDMMITLSPDYGASNSCNVMGILTVNKNRRGNTGHTYYLREPTGRFSELSTTLYTAAKASNDIIYYKPFDGCKDSSQYTSIQMNEDIIDAFKSPLDDTGDTDETV